MSKKGNLAKNALIISIGTFLPKLAGFITLPIITGYLTKEQYGTYDLITVLVSLYLPSITLQIKTAAFRFLLDVREDTEKQKKIITNIFAVTFPVSIIALIVLLLFLPNDSMSVKLWICGYYFADIMANTARQIARGVGKNFHYSISSIISAVGKMLLAVLFVWWIKLGLLGAVIALCVSTILSFIYISVCLKLWKFIDIRFIDKSLVKSMLNYSLPNVPNDMAFWVMNVSDRLIVTKVLGIAVNAMYAASTKIPQLINLAQSVFNLAWQENAALSLNDKDSKNYYTEMFHVMMKLQAGAFGLVISSAPVLFPLLINSKYAEAYAQIPLLCAALFFSGMAIYYGGIYLAYKETKSVGLSTTISAIVNIIVDISLINYIEVYAASVSTLVSYVCLFIYRSINVRKFVKIKINFRIFVLIISLMVVEIILYYQQDIVCNLINVVLGYGGFIILNMNIINSIFTKIKSKIHH